MTLAEFCDRACNQVPWRRGAWYGQFLSLDGTVAGDFKPEDIWRVLAVGCTEDGAWDGVGAAVVQLWDGRWVAWESSWGPTGSGFSEDAYGGGANVYFASSLEGAIMLGLTPSSRELLRLDTENWSDPKAKLPELELIT
jgi:hypothetical protein